ncbi:neprilysin-1-like isoform X1 [Ruditapes philippinarum]|uniref:neprilysin-1-like isoform X1 n=1 Tax=Ruditapes philippinarum TaxID=129788 RepID=UPI00295C2DB7|nr:neprilysin-1-like isoform X1 [Ruditapes philippinarum]
MSKFTKRASKEKVDKMGVEVGYPEEIYNDALLNLVHKQFSITSGSPFTTAVSMSKAEMVREAQLLREPVFDDPWNNSPLIVTAKYRSRTNTIIINSGILQDNVYSHGSPKYMNYGSVGMIIGHEITHGFVGKGRTYDEEGKQRTWWLQRDVDTIERKTQCFIDMWSNFTIPGTGGMKNDGELTLNEVLPDHEGTRISYKAYRRIVEKQRNGKEEKRLPGLPYTPNQLFFINLVQPLCTNIRNDIKKFWIQNFAHPLSLIRFVGLMQNSEEFADTWNCPVGSNMNPADKCTLYQ